MARTSIRDVAREAGVSPATVSRFLNGRWTSMSAETRERIAEVVERTGYRPSSVARSLRLETSHTLGVVMADVRNPYSGEVLQELCDQAESAGYTLMCSFSENDPTREAEAVERLVDARVDGLVVNTTGSNDELIAKTAARVPTCLLDRAISGPDGSTCAVDLVTSDNARLVENLLDLLARRGARRAALLTEPVSTSATRRARADAFAEGLSRHGMGGSVEGLGEGGEGIEEVLVRLARGRGEGPLAIVAVNGLVFLRLAEAIRGSGLAVGHDVALATFDDYAWNRVLFGGVTTVAQDTARVAGEVLVRVLARAKDPTRPTGRVEVPGTVIERASTRLS